MKNFSQLYAVKAEEMLVPDNETQECPKPFVPWGHAFINYRGLAARSISPCRNQP